MRSRNLSVYFNASVAILLLVLSHSKPTDSTCPSDKWIEIDHSCYKVSTSVGGYTYDECEEKCSPGQLICINDAKENQLVYDSLVKDNPDINGVFVGISDSKEEEHWLWQHGCSSNFTFFFDGEPNDCGRDGEDCAAMLAPRAHWPNEGTVEEVQWFDVRCNMRIGCLCEFFNYPNKSISNSTVIFLENEPCNDGIDEKVAASFIVIFISLILWIILAAINCCKKVTTSATTQQIESTRNPLQEESSIEMAPYIRPEINDSTYAKI